MGCDVCEIQTPRQYALCQKIKKSGKRRTSPCGQVEFGVKTNVTPKKKKRKK